ncbi:hypothetical protein G3578_20175 [Brevibacillus sp. SYP-B805]|uniref:hypothetical protein n=1 Tax=Brevibacillus sp. SYP-B805 TaxID=1578199 RepID=UPI0013ECCE76|nr:hypothetical protein [Brevibacillus sp. SYP-B805]NGQ97458.1 hypothetical protein [Brevibacillus sp. SYP-B805]
MKDAVMIVLSVLFGASILYVMWFQVREGRDERGQFILRRTYGIAYGVIVLGVIALITLCNWATPEIYPGYTLRDALYLVLCLSGIAAGVSLIAVKAKY